MENLAGIGGSYSIDPKSGETKLVECTDVTIVKPEEKVYTSAKKTKTDGVKDAAAN